MTASRIDPDSRSRLPGIKRDDLDERGRALIDQRTDPTGGYLAGLQGRFGIRLHSPMIAECAKTLTDFFRRDSVLEKHSQKVAILVTARAHDSEFEWSAHDPAARRAGAADAPITAILKKGSTDGLTADDGLVIDLDRQLFETRRIEQDLYDRASAHFGDRGLVELISLMAQYAGTPHMLAAFDMQLPEGKEPVMG